MVTYVIDGDTFVADGRRIRIWGIDAPEKDEAYYQTSTLTLEGMIDGALLNCTLREKGKYRRDVMRCYKGDIDIGAAMVRKGMAKDVPRSLIGYYERDQIHAQKNKLGIWAD